MRMTELEREMILADRAEERDKARQRKQLLQSTRGAEEKQDKQDKGKMATEEHWKMSLLKSNGGGLS
eukprot:scaffold125277_cov24-Tisochrysis_lutea.AAC.1